MTTRGSAGASMAGWRLGRGRSQQRGIALVMVLGAITLLTVLLTQLQEDTSAELASALAERDALRAEYHARSGMNLGRLLIAMEPDVGRSVAIFFGGKAPQIPIWAFSDALLGAFNGQGGPEAFGAFMPNADFSSAKNLGIPGGGHFELRIVDEESKLNVNTVYSTAGTISSELRVGSQLLGLIGAPQYDLLFQGRDPDGQFSDRATICGALIDWADPDENLFPCNPTQQGPGAGGAEDNIYAMMGLPYRRKNAGFDSLEELRLVRGVSDQFWETFVEPEAGRPDKRTLTVWGAGQVNVNTANAMTLLALVCGSAPEAELCNDPMQAQAFLSAVTMVRTLFAGFPLFPSTGAFMQAVSAAAAEPEKAAGATPTNIVGSVLAALGIRPVVFKDPKGLKAMITTRSRIFSFYVEGVVPGGRKETRTRLHGVVDFRSAPALALGSGPTGQGPTSASVTSNPSGQGSLNSALGATNGMSVPGNPAGNVVYYRVE